MNLRFLLFAGPPQSRDALVERAELANHPGLRRGCAGGVFELWTPESTSVACSDDGAAILVGTLISKVEGDSRPRIGGTAWEPAQLARAGWGAYVAFGERPAGGHFAFRDPSGEVVVYHRREGHCDVYASDDDLLWRGAMMPPAPDLDFIRQWLTFPFVRTARTGAIGVRELLPGQTLEVTANAATLTQSWSPADHFPPRRRAMDPGSATRALRKTLLRCIPQLVPETGPVFLKLSGGLDSSLVAAALAQAGRAFTAITFATRDRDGDERRYARLVAEACGVELIEIEEQVDDHPADLAPAPRDWLRPPRQPLLQRLDRAYALHWTACGADTVVTGAGGDNVFAALPTAVAAVDAWVRAGPVAACRTVADLAAVHHCTFWQALGHARRRAQRGAIYTWPENRGFLKSEAVAAQVEPHPWLMPELEHLPGSIEHLRMIVGAYRFIGDPAPSGPGFLHPLLAQPVVELCLSIPSDVWIAGGRDRAIARTAFADLLPATVLERRSKGGLGTMFRAQFAQVARSLGELLIEGRLADAGIVDRGAVMTYLHKPQHWADGLSLRLLDLAAAEQWLRGFQSAPGHESSPASRAAP